MTKNALIVVDMQNDFMHGGNLEVQNADSILLNVNKLISSFRNEKIVATKDWHPMNHFSFARNAGVKPFEVASDGQIKWPDHCIAGTWGSEFHKNINTYHFNAVFHKGLDSNVESYSGFKDANGKDSGLANYFEDCTDTLFVCGLAFDYCVKATALHASEWFNTYIVSDATMPVDPNFKPDFLSDNIKLISTEQAILHIKKENKI